MKLKVTKVVLNKFLPNVLPQPFRSLKLYCLPKTHKNDYKTNLQFRPIFCTFNFNCTNLSIEITKFLKVYVFNKTFRTSFAK